MKSLPLVSKTQTQKILLLTAMLPLLAIFSVFYFLILTEIKSEPISAWTVDTRADCAVVLTGGAGRVREGIALLSRGLVKKLIISGVNPEVELHELYQAGANTYGWNDEDIVLEKKSATTFGNAQQTWPLVEALGCRSIALVTSQLHMPRAYKTFQKTFPEGFATLKHTIPTSQSEGNWFEFSNEIVKSWFYSAWAY